MLKGAFDPLGSNQVRNPGQPHHIIKKFIPPLFHVVKQVVNSAQAGFEIALHVFVVIGHLPFDVVQKLGVFLERFQVGLAGVQLFFDQFMADAQWIEQFEAETAVIIQRIADERFQRFKAAGRPQPRLAHLRLLRLLGRHGKHGRNLAHQITRRIADKNDDFFPVGFVSQNVHFVHHQDDFLAPIADLGQEITLAFGERTVSRGDKQNQVAAGDKFGRQRLMFAQDGIGSRRVHNTDFSQNLNRRRLHPNAFFHRLLLRLVAIFQQVNLAGRRCDAFFQQRLAQ